MPKVLENRNLRIKLETLEHLCCYVRKISSTFRILARRTWAHLSVAVGKLFTQIGLCLGSSCFRLWRRCRWRFFVSFDERTDSSRCPVAPAHRRAQHQGWRCACLCSVFEEWLAADAFWSDKQGSASQGTFLWGSAKEIVKHIWISYKTSCLLPLP